MCSHSEVSQWQQQRKRIAQQLPLNYHLCRHCYPRVFLCAQTLHVICMQLGALEARVADLQQQAESAAAALAAAPDAAELSAARTVRVLWKHASVEHRFSPHEVLGALA